MSIGQNRRKFLKGAGLGIAGIVADGVCGNAYAANSEESGGSLAVECENFARQ